MKSLLEVTTIERVNPVQEVCEWLAEDSGLWQSYQDNISLSFQDEFERESKNSHQIIPNIKKIADRAAENFLALWTSKVTKDRDPELKYEGKLESPKDQPEKPIDERIKIEEDFCNLILDKIQRVQESPLYQYAAEQTGMFQQTVLNVKISGIVKMLLTILISETLEEDEMFASLSILQNIIWHFATRPPKSFFDNGEDRKQGMPGNKFSENQADNGANKIKS